MPTAQSTISFEDIDGAIFDFDGTLAVTAPLWKDVDRSFLGKRGIEYTPEYGTRLATLGFTAGAQWTIDTYGLDETVEEICREWTEEGYERYRNEITLRDGAAAVVEAFTNAGVTCALATNNNRELLGSMRHIDIDSLFDVQVYGREVAAQKDEPDIYLEAARRLGCAPERCLVFEDIPEGIIAGKRAGMTVCAMRDDFSADQEPRKALLSDWMISDYRELIRTGKDAD